jgi:hypothetical protein
MITVHSWVIWDRKSSRIHCSCLNEGILAHPHLPNYSDQRLYDAFATRYPSVQKARVVREKSGRTRGYGFVSFRDAQDFAKAIREMNGKWYRCLFSMQASFLYASIHFAWLELDVNIFFICKHSLCMVGIGCEHLFYMQAFTLHGWNWM